jgi:hypothetical protein
MKFCVIILSTKIKSYQGFKVAIRNTWGANLKKNNIDYFFYEGDWESDEIVGDTIRLNCDDSLNGTFDKFIKAADIIFSKYNYDFLFRTNLSSYINVDNFISFIKKNNINISSYEGHSGATYFLRELPYFLDLAPLKIMLSADKIYTLKKVSNIRYFFKNYFSNFYLFRKITFKSGAGFFIGRKRFHVLNSTKPKIKFIDDVMIGIIISNRTDNIEFQRFDVKKDFSHVITLSEYEKLLSKGLFHFRLKNEDRKFDISMMYLLNDKKIRDEICTSKLAKIYLYD